MYKKVNPATLREVIIESGVSFKENANSFIFTCPKCNKPDKLWMIKETGQFVCWRCKETENFYGRPEWALAELLGTDLSHVRKLIYGEDAGPLTNEEPLFDLKDFYENPDFIPPSGSPMFEISMPMDAFPIDNPIHGVKGRIYLHNRGISEAVAKDFGVYYWPSKQRILFPVTDGQVLVAWQARTINDEVKPKILSSDNIRRDKTLMFWERYKDQGYLILAEGPIDAIKCHLCGPAVASMGKMVTKGQIDLIVKAGVKTLYIALDPDAMAEIRSLADSVKERGLNVKILLPPEGKKDLGECTPEEVLAAFKNAPDYSHNLFVFKIRNKAFFA